MRLLFSRVPINENSEKIENWIFRFILVLLFFFATNRSIKVKGKLWERSIQRWDPSGCCVQGAPKHKKELVGLLPEAVLLELPA